MDEIKDEIEEYLLSLRDEIWKMSDGPLSYCGGLGWLGCCSEDCCLIIFLI